MTSPATVHIFCRVIDNYGDIGVCWRLARQLAGEHGLEVALWVDDLASFQRICAAVDLGHDSQQVQGIRVMRWHAQIAAFAASEVADLVIEAFACELPASYVAAMAQRSRKPVWLNLEYLSAEPWVEGCHALPSPHPFLPLTKHFFFPGFSPRTGGLLLEQGLLEKRIAFQQQGGASAFLSGIGVQPRLSASLISLFCYPSAPVTALFSALQADSFPAFCLVPQGVAPRAVEGFLQRPAQAGASATRGNLTVQVIPFLDQPDYDRLLWSCDLNFVRGEDSLVRAQWAGRPFVWQIYPQQEEAHRTKLDAFIGRYTAGLEREVAETVGKVWAEWNLPGTACLAWKEFRPMLPQLSFHMEDWLRLLRQNGDLASNLLRFAREIG